MIRVELSGKAVKRIHAGNPNRRRSMKLRSYGDIAMSGVPDSQGQRIGVK